MSYEELCPFLKEFDGETYCIIWRIENVGELKHTKMFYKYKLPIFDLGHKCTHNFKHCIAYERIQDFFNEGYTICIEDNEADLSNYIST